MRTHSSKYLFSTVSVVCLACRFAHIQLYKSRNGGLITQNGKHIALYSRKLNTALQRYATGEQELFFIVETLCEFRNTNHKIITNAKITSDTVMRCSLII
jgi:hypothetical protein